jgi:hypothetical protein
MRVVKGTSDLRRRELIGQVIDSRDVLGTALEGALEWPVVRTLGCRRSTRSRRRGTPGEEGDVVLLPGRVN